MKRIFLMFLLAAATLPACLVAVRAQDFGAARHSPLQFTIVPPLSTNGRDAASHTNGVSLNLFVGVSENERLVTISGLGAIIRRDASVVQISGIFTHIGGDGWGVVASGAANITRKNYAGIQAAGGVNAASRVFGLQIAGGVNAARDAYGLQIGPINAARNVKGFQIGALNAARNVRGLQIGALNAAREVRGVQIGVVNFARRSDYPLGLLNIVTEGEASLVLTYNDLGLGAVTLHTGARALYGILGAGYTVRERHSNALVSLIGGFGARLNIWPWLRINNELTVESLGEFHRFTDIVLGPGEGSDGYSGPNRGGMFGSASFKVTGALMPGIRLWRGLEIFAGPTVNFLQTDGGLRSFGPSEREPFWQRERVGGRWISGSNGFSETVVERRQRAFFGWQCGVKLIFLRSDRR